MFSELSTFGSGVPRARATGEFVPKKRIATWALARDAANRALAITENINTGGDFIGFIEESETDWVIITR